MPRNPFKAEMLYGVDIREFDEQPADFNYKQCNLITQAIPYPDNFFDSVSAYDFLEHIPRVIIYNDQTRFPFVELMNEIHRVLKPSGELYALTPYYPKESCFIDPTHVNFITPKTHRYFVKPDLMANMYGFSGSFEDLRVEPVNSLFEVNSHWGFLKRLKVRYKLLKSKHKTALKGKQHLVWHFKKA